MTDRREVKHVEKLPKGIELGRNIIYEQGKPVRVIAQKRRIHTGFAVKPRGSNTEEFTGFKLRVFRRG